MFTAEEERIGAAVERLAGAAANPVPGGIAGDGCGNQRQVEGHDVEVAARGKEAGGDEQRVAGQKEPDQQSCFGEHDQDQPDQPAETNQLGNVVDGLEKGLDEPEQVGHYT